MEVLVEPISNQKISFFDKHTKKILASIIVAAFLIRILGVNFGLPLWLISDEPPFTAAALKMLELKTLLPVLHEETFKQIIYFPPYLSYIYLLPFSLIIGIKYIFWTGGFEQFKNFLILDPSIFFLFARILNVILGTITVWLVYLITKNIFQDKETSIFSSFFLAFSLLHIDLSFVGRDWVPATFLFALVLYFLTKPKMSFKMRFLTGAIIAGFAFGISLISGFIMLFMLLWYLFYEKHTIMDIFREKILYVSLFIFLGLSIVSVLVFPFGFVFAHYTSISNPKSVISFFEMIYYFFIPILKSEPAFIITAILGLIAIYKDLRKFFWVIVSFISLYEIIFYFTYHYHPRFTIYLFPLISILAGYGLKKIHEKFESKWKYLPISLLILLPILSSLFIITIVRKNDSRIELREWVEKTIPENSKILLGVRLTRLSATKGAIKEQENIDPKSLRQVDYAEQSFENNPQGLKRFHVLNLYTVDNNSFFLKIEKYAKDQNYEYLIFDPFMEDMPHDRMVAFNELRKKSTLIKTFGQNQKYFSVESGEFGPITKLPSLEKFGPFIEVYRLN